jgi:hypothetical protein
MDYKKLQPAENYEGLKRQFLALKRILHCKEEEVRIYRERVKEFNLDRIIELESELESQKEMNSILTLELESYLNKL